MIVAEWQQQLDLFRDERGLWRCRGRIQNAGVPYCTKHPVLLHKDHHFTMLVVKQAHSRVLHGGVKETLAELRSKFWIVRGRNFVRASSTSVMHAEDMKADHIVLHPHLHFRLFELRNHPHSPSQV